MSEKVKIGVIGIGAMGKPHLRDVATLENTELVAVCDINHTSADQSAT